MSHLARTIGVTLAMLAVSFAGCRDPNSERAHSDFRTAILEGQLDTVRRWLEAGLDPNEEPTGECSTPLALAALDANEAIVDLLAGHGSELNRATGPSGRTALGCVAAAEDNPDIVSLLIDLGAEVNAPDQEGRTPLIDAAQAGFIDTVRVLLEARADVYAKTASGATAVDLAAAAQQSEIVTLLVRAGARPVDSAQQNEAQTSDPGLPSIVTAVGNITLGESWDDLKPMLDTGTWIDTAHPTPTRAIETRRINGAVYHLTFEREGKTGQFKLVRIDRE